MTDEIKTTFIPITQPDWWAARAPWDELTQGSDSPLHVTVLPLAAWKHEASSSLDNYVPLYWDPELSMMRKAAEDGQYLYIIVGPGQEIPDTDAVRLAYRTRSIMLDEMVVEDPGPEPEDEWASFVQRLRPDESQ